ncbi:putative disease resistance protein At3g14460 [Arachis stenosperma]|uniref:putative disease resistance protein At3g14460 n=1 Tax=Arachis stenosperma TaxID=217475 RepID=UPI0025ABA103|nr:putative disease resistance protein At3g14460 [Arachis stenosperma]XP_057742986.1 putative disease resistance protein At3g14460 [Arachis stenosperma]XP_057742987.1 putative disease resistance protein At3g14460 [Arachis stenosperma]XP_057742988.1 putative disease resistance protein At3g14460 [Arachis stenosperma]XP_057742989.1 putative disease resistance protein At3g14460 [Arachis stenosperma]XP_057742990.1 putative disease resistance protein At3g14460 [Arachis stenosperma]
MAAELVGGALLSSFIDVVIDRLLTTDAVNLVLGNELGPDLVEKLKTALLGAEALVADAEMKQFGNPSVRKWLDNLRDAVYCAEDLLDTVLIKATTQKKKSSCCSLSFFINRHRDDMVDKMEGVVIRIEDLGKQKDFLGLEKIPTGSSSWRTPTSSLVRGNVYGREDDKKALVQMLNDNNEHHLSVIAIVGIGGVGKTTLAQWLYNNQEEFMKGFDLKAWVCVSEKFEVVETTRNVIKEISPDTQCLEHFNSLHHALKEKLLNKKFFIVLDDVWSDDGDKWSNFMTPFQYGKKGSIVLLTTRGNNVALAVQNCRPYFLRKLSEDYCWSVFAENASFPESNGRAALEEIGRKIVRKCDGLPLAAETLGRLLRTKHDVEEWNKILMSHIWGFAVQKSKIIPALLISYFHLPPHLKGCFVYCALYPKDYKFVKDELILLWMAEALLTPEGGKSLEVIGREYFDELTSRLFFTKNNDGDDYFVMHDLLHDLAIFLAGDFYCNLEELGKEEEIRIQPRHLCANLCYCSSKLPNLISEVKSLRTLLLFGDCSSSNCNIEAATWDILSKFKYLRALSFCKRGVASSLSILVVPDSIKELVHLRYLDLSGTNIKTLPESLCNLSSLQTLKLYYCSNLTTLPSGLHNLLKLRHLDIRGTSLEEMPGKMSKLNQLLVLSYFVVGKHEDNGIQELGGLENLHGRLEITKLENIVDVKEAESAKIMDKKHIDVLCLQWSSGEDMVSDTQREKVMLDKLEPHNGLKELRIWGYKGTIFPDWLGCSYQNMTSVSLESCKNCCMLPSLGQLPSLKSLRIKGLDELRSIGEEFYKNEGDHHSSHIAPFPSLEILEFNDMACWEEWHLPDSKVFPQLKRLQIRKCPILKEEMLNQVFFRIVSSLPDVSKARKLLIGDAVIDLYSEAMFLDGDTLRIRGSESVMESALKALMSINHLRCLQEIHIWSCSKLEFPQLQQHKYDLVDLLIDSCDSLTSLSLDVFPNLKDLKISYCRNLESVSMSEAPHAALQRLSIFKCPELVSFAGEGLAAPNLTHLQVSFCSKLEALPRDMKSLLPSLHSLQIYGCPNICRLPEGGLPPNLKEFEVGIGEQQMRDLSWIPNLHALTHLTIRGRECKNIKSYPEVGSLPHLPSLTTLKICWFDNLETLECNELLRLTSLQQLHIDWCPKLENMEGEKLPPSLLLLQIKECGLLGEHCKNKHQLIWPKISHIPTIQVSDRDFTGDILSNLLPLSIQLYLMFGNN